MTERITRASHLRWLPVSELRVETDAQRKLRPGWVTARVDDFDPEKLGYMVVAIAAEDGFSYIIDGQHRVALLRAVGWGDQQAQCEVYEGLNQVERAEMFLARNDRIQVRTLDKFLIRRTAGDPVAVDIDRIVRAHGLAITETKPLNGAIRSPASLEFVYRGGFSTAGQPNPRELARTLDIIVTAWGSASEVMQSPVIRGIGLVCLRYDGELDAAELSKRLSRVPGGPGGLIGRASLYREAKGRAVADCVAAVVVDLYNRGRRGKKLVGWWAP